MNRARAVLEYMGKETTVPLVEGSIVNIRFGRVCPLVYFTQGYVIAGSAVFRKVMRVKQDTLAGFRQNGYGSGQGRVFSQRMIMDVP